MANKAVIEPIRTLGFAGISGTYAKVGTPFEYKVRVICISNNTEGDLHFTTDELEDQLFIAAGSYKLFDIQANKNNVTDNDFVLPIGTQFFVKQITAPVSGAVYIEVIH